MFICLLRNVRRVSSEYGANHPPYAKPPLVSSFDPPGPCITPSREILHRRIFCDDPLMFDKIFPQRHCMPLTKLILFLQPVSKYCGFHISSDNALNKGFLPDLIWRLAGLCCDVVDVRLKRHIFVLHTLFYCIDRQNRQHTSTWLETGVMIFDLFWRWLETTVRMS